MKPAHVVLVQKHQDIKLLTKMKLYVTHLLHCVRDGSENGQRCVHRPADRCWSRKNQQA